MHDGQLPRLHRGEVLDAEDSNDGPTPKTRQGDPVIGDAQAGALNGGFSSYLGRDNANMVDLWVPPITNMYLWSRSPEPFLCALRGRRRRHGGLIRGTKTPPHDPTTA